MMGILRRWFNGETKAARQQEDKSREDRFRQVTDGLHEAATRVHYLEMEAELRARTSRPNKDN